MVHPITEALPPPPKRFGSGECLDIYICGVHTGDKAGALTQGFGVVFEISDGTAIDPIAAGSNRPSTNNSRGELGALITTLEWVSLYAPQSEVRIYSIQEYIYKWASETLNNLLANRKAKNRDLLLKVSSLLPQLPRVTIAKLSRSPSPKLHEKARELANAIVRSRAWFPAAHSQEGDVVNEEYVTIDDEFWMERAISRDKF
ncbi:hypothetical protein [Prosthecodimorpha hirschii]|uniref:hypothetical protein n=1 Tax=Prosthecodimorpha hirschii TaxID=665126 RepID=UPI0011290D3C|nr:hypothetical protein [Prosthecomicrobium hirschii]